MNYYDTLIEVAEDCPATEGQVPQARGGKKTKAVVEYELLVNRLFAKPAKRYPQLLDVARKADRVIPMIVLTPRGNT